jgi:aryl-alcohol dehydrogenase-like predicted oxidoreductase/HEAT repeat protein
MADLIADLLSAEVSTRQEALDAVPLDGPGLFALRQILLHDAAAPLRVAAAERLGRHPDRAGAAGWLSEAVEDRYPSVREAALLALGRVGSADLLVQLERSGAEDPTWWVRRAAARAAAAVGLRCASDRAVAALRRQLDDPFWRVRHAAAQGLGQLGDEHPALRVEILQPLAGAQAASALALIAARWDRAAPPPQLGASRPFAPLDAPRGVGLDNDDPAVVTAHLEALDAPALDPLALVPLLADSHEPLRRVAVRRLAQSSHPGALKAALRWLDEVRVPHAVETVRRLLDAAEPGQVDALAEAVLAEGTEEVGTLALPGALRWAVERAGVRQRLDLAGRLTAVASHARAEVRCAALFALGRIAVGELCGPDSAPAQRLLDGLVDPAAEVRAAAVEALAPLASQHPALREALSQLPLAGQTAPTRCLLLESGGVASTTLQTAAADDPHPAVRATALRMLRRDAELPGALRAAALADPDPWVRAAALDPQAAPALLDADPDPWVARLAARAAGAMRALPLPDRLELAARMLGRDDSWIRARGCELLTPGPASDAGPANDEESLTALRRLLELTRERTPMVRAAAAEQLERCAGLERRLEALLQLEGLAPTLRASAYTWLLRGEDEVTVARLAAALRDAEEPPEVQEHLHAVALIHAAALREAHGLELPPPVVEPLAAPRPGRTAPPRAAEPARRRIGRTSIEVAPLCISGANGCAPAALAQARDRGVNLFFWEPRYAEQTRFLRRRREDRDLVVAAGTFNADRAGIERDVELALRRLRRPQIDLFLLFWARSPERLGAAPFEALQRLKRQGKIRAAGFSTHHRELAVAALAQREWDLVMLRHSAAHPGAERELLPAAERAGTGVLTFSALCYGRMLRPHGELSRPTAADCYRYSLAQPAVAACISAPRFHRELEHNLQVMTAPTLTAAAAAALRAQGAAVYAQDTRFNTLLRQAPQGSSVSADADAPRLLRADPPPATPERSDPWSSR